MTKQIKPYTKRQQGIIDGSVAYEDVHGQEYCAIIKKATAMKDEELAARMRELHAKKKEEYRFRNNEANKRRYHEYGKYHTELKIPEVHKTEYSERQKRIIRGEIPYEDVSTKELLPIIAKARKVGDIQLAETIRVLAEDKHADAVERKRQKAHERRLLLKGREPHSRKHTERINGYDEWEWDLIESKDDADDYTLESLQELLKTAERIGTNEDIRVAKFLIDVKEHPDIIYIAKTKEEAYMILQEATLYPLPQPEKWFE